MVRKRYPLICQYLTLKIYLKGCILVLELPAALIRRWTCMRAAYENGNETYSLLFPPLLPSPLVPTIRNGLCSRISSNIYFYNVPENHSIRNATHYMLLTHTWVASSNCLSEWRSNWVPWKHLCGMMSSRTFGKRMIFTAGYTPIGKNRSPFTFQRTACTVDSNYAFIMNGSSVLPWSSFPSVCTHKVEGGQFMPFENSNTFDFRTTDSIMTSTHGLVIKPDRYCACQLKTVTAKWLE